MKKKIIIGLSVLVLTLSTTVFTVYAYTHKRFSNKYFTIVNELDRFGKYKIIYANDTRVIYLICVSGHHFGITPLYNADGTLQIYGEGE